MCAHCLQRPEADTGPPEDSVMENGCKRPGELRIEPRSTVRTVSALNC